MMTLFNVFFALVTSLSGAADNDNSNRDDIVWPGGTGNGKTQVDAPAETKDGIIWPGATGLGKGE